MARPSDWDEVFDIKDPTPGDTYDIDRVARTWGTIADKAEYAETKLRGLLGDEAVATWIGQAGDAFRERTSELPGQLEKAKNSYRQASEALEWWSGRLGDHQHDADDALVKGREAKQDLEDARTQLASASTSLDAVAGADALKPYSGGSGPPPSEHDVKAAKGKLDAAKAAESQAQGLVDNAQARLDAARSLAEQAGDLRKKDGRTTADKIHDAADAGIKPRSRWQKFKDGVAAAWDIIIKIAKVVVAVLGIVALIIGGPLAWIVFAAALLVLADTLMKYMKGQASLLDVALAALSCIPGTKGLTTLSALSKAYKAGGTLGATVHVLAAGKTTLSALAQSVAHLPSTANALRKGLVPSLKAAVQVLGREGATVTPSLRTTLREMSSAFSSSMHESRVLLNDARNFQGTRGFPGRDAYGIERLSPGTTMEAGYPGVSQYSMPGGTAAANGHSASGVWEGVQVGPQDAAARYPGYRGSMVELHVNQPFNVASGPTLANPQYGAGGTHQYFSDLNSHIANGNISVIGPGGTPIHIPEGTAPTDVHKILEQPQNLGTNGTIQLHGKNSWNAGIDTQQQTAAANPDLPWTNHRGLPPADFNGLSTILRGAGYVGSSR
jgi:hypothetical protein